MEFEVKRKQAAKKKSTNMNVRDDLGNLRAERKNFLAFLFHSGRYEDSAHPTCLCGGTC